ncbi:MAG: 30S ribosomal protein S20 [Acidimicrobiia bacterium]
MGDDAEATDAAELGQDGHSRGWGRHCRDPACRDPAVGQLLACLGSLKARNGYMANIKSQKKRNRQNERRRERNKAVRTELKTRVKVATIALESESDDAQELVEAAQKRLGKAASAGIIHKNQAARRTSRMMRRANSSSAGD